ncbi:MAG TPA: nucleoside 2-deoxyribosyltransferase [Anaerolineales bacterium]
MNIYFACSITGGRQDELVYQAIVHTLLADGHFVPTAHLSAPEVMALESVVDPGEVFLRDVNWIDACDALIAEISTPSHGVGYEIAHALNQGKKVLCCYQEGRRISKMISGNTLPGLRIRAYRDHEEAIHIVREFLKGLPTRSGETDSS